MRGPLKVDEEALKKYFQLESNENVSFDLKNKKHKVIFTAGFIRGIKYALKHQCSSDLVRKSLKDFEKKTPLQPQKRQSEKYRGW